MLYNNIKSSHLHYLFPETGNRSGEHHPQSQLEMRANLQQFFCDNMRGRRERRISELSIYIFRMHRVSDAATVFSGRRTQAGTRAGNRRRHVSSFPLAFASNPLRFPGRFSNFMAAVLKPEKNRWF